MKGEIVTPEFENLKKKDYLHGFQVHTDHYHKVRRVRQVLGLPTGMNEQYDTRTGYNIEGTALNTRHHPLHDYYLIKKATNEVYIIDLVCIHHDLGTYQHLAARRKGTKSHATIIWEAISSKSPFILQCAKESKERYSIHKKQSYEESEANL